jgi:hypothetical protein
LEIYTYLFLYVKRNECERTMRDVIFKLIFGHHWSWMVEKGGEFFHKKF